MIDKHQHSNWTLITCFPNNWARIQHFHSTNYIIRSQNSSQQIEYKHRGMKKPQSAPRSVVVMAVIVGGRRASAAAVGALASISPRAPVPAAGALVVAAVLVEGDLLVEDAALLGALAAEALVVHRPLLPRHLLLAPPLQPQHHRLRRLRRGRRRGRGRGGRRGGGVNGHGHGSGWRRVRRRRASRHGNWGFSTAIACWRSPLIPSFWGRPCNNCNGALLVRWGTFCWRRKKS